MIFPRPLTAEERAISVRRLFYFNVTNGFSYACVGESIVVLLAVKLGCSNAFASSLGTLMYIGFLMLPLGQMLAGRIGAAKSEGFFWALRNAFAMLIASSAFWAAQGSPSMVTASILIGSLGFYGCRAAGVVLQQPLLGEIALPEERSQIIGRCGSLFYISGFCGIASIVCLLSRSQAVSTLVGIISVGSVLGVWASWFLSRIHESDVLSRSAREPVRKNIRFLLRNPAFRRLLTACVSLNVATMLVFPTMLVVLKRGYGVSDLQALLWSLSQWFASACGSHITGYLGKKIGPRKEMLYAYFCFGILSLGWIFLAFSGLRTPLWICGIFWLFFFFLGGLSRAIQENAVSHYFLTITDPRLRISGSVLLYTVMGALAGITGFIIVRILMNWAAPASAALIPGTPEAIRAFAKYYFAVLLLLFCALPTLLRLIPLPEEERTRIKPHEHQRLRH